MSQVKNLRAMFEQKGDSSPPDRGRVQQGLPTPADSPRPLSRVRTSFVTVEKDGRVGLQRDTSSDSIPTLSRTISAGTDSDVAVPAGVPQDKSEAPAEADDAKLPAVAQTPKRIPAPIPEEATPVTPTKAAAPLASPSKPALEATPKPALPPAAEVKVSALTSVRISVETPGRKSPSKALDTKAAQRDKSPTPSPRKLFAKPLGSTENPSTPGTGTPRKTLDVPLASEPKKVSEPTTNGNPPVSKPEPPAVVAATAAASSNGVLNGTAKDAKASSAIAKPATSSAIPIRPKAASSSTSSGKDTHKTATATKTAPKAISTMKANTKPATKSPGLAVKTPTVKMPKTPTSPGKSSTTAAATTKLPAKAADRKTHAAADKSAVAKTTSNTVHKTTTTAKSSTAATASTKAKPVPIPTFPSNGIGFVKPKPKSPTRPVQLPSSLTTHTASSATKANVPRQSLSRQSGNFLALHPPTGAARSPSRTSVSTVGTASGGSGVTGGKTLRRQSSTVGRPRPSIGPPPKQAARDHPVTKREKEVDEGFLARMMRPTQASALKTADKAHLSSPPRKQHTMTTTTITTTRKSIAPRESLPVPVKKSVVAKPLSLPPRPPACITRNPMYPAVPAEETVANPYKSAETTDAEKTFPEADVSEPAVEDVAEDAVEEPIEERAQESVEEVAEELVEEELTEKPVEEPVEEPVKEPIEEVAEEGIEDVVKATAEEEEVEEEEVSAVEVPAEEEDTHEEMHEESVDEPTAKLVTEEPAKPESEPVDEETVADKEIHPVLAAEDKEEMPVEEGKTSSAGGVAAAEE
ncbi:hypothetical protein SCUCBS95973_002533 [Sporothrix curviconia]|uniref:Mucin-7 n=1 Tax=Sporothrix curviconia TaxID=1260050 RepID=A0ABP0B7X3_9PEZI